MHTIALHPRFTVLVGQNGQGKTNVLEAIYFAATSRSFRTSNIRECVAHDRASASVSVRIVDSRESGILREQAIGISDGRRTLTINGKRPATQAGYALQTPIVLFEPASLQLSQGGASERRRLLDRVAAQIASDGEGATFLGDLERYRRAHVGRKRALEARWDSSMVASYEEIMAEHGARIVQMRAHSAGVLAEHAARAFAQIAQLDDAINVTYAPRAPADRGEFATALAERRVQDQRRGSATIGPHLDDVVLNIGGRAAKHVASQGQHRALVLALKSAELSAIAEARGVRPILLLDDVSSELDPIRNRALFDFLDTQVGQVIISTTRSDHIRVEGKRLDLLVSQGVVIPAQDVPRQQPP